MSTMDYRTKSEIIPRDNGSLPGVWPVAMDIGYSGVKIFSPNKTAVFPSFAKKYEFFGTVGHLENDEISYKDLDTGEEWLVGRSAQNSISKDESNTSDEAMFTRNRYQSPIFKVIARVGLALGMMPNKHGEMGDRKLRLQTGLPPAFAVEDSPKLRRVLSGHHHFSVKIGNANTREFEFDLDADNIYIMPQPMGTLYSVLITNDHKFVPKAQEYLSKNILVFDPGFGTFDIFPLKGHRVGASQTFTDLGMKQVLKETSAAIQKKYHEVIKVADMQQYLEIGAVKLHDDFTFSSKLEPFEDMLNEASAKVCNEAILQMAQVFPMHEIDCLILTGGTSAAWEPMIRQRLSGLSTLEIIDGNCTDKTLSLIYANVRGYYQYFYKNFRTEIE